MQRAPTRHHFDRRIDDPPTQHRRQLASQLDAEHARSASSKRDGGLSGAGADLANTTADVAVRQLGEVSTNSAGYVGRARSYNSPSSLKLVPDPSGAT